MAPSQHAYSRIARKMQAPAPGVGTPWSPPALGELIARIDAALGTRRAA
ncbi:MULTISPECIES: hypothetical protein [unclassified Sphingomonas]|nr:MULTISPECIES: hypothetical protein [unclassified Sphingomonas]